MNKMSHSGTDAPADYIPAQASDAEYLRLLGETVRAARARRGMTRKMLASHSGVSERFLAQLESGTGNASVLILRLISQALDVPPEALLPGQGRSVEMEHALDFLQRLAPSELAEARELLLHRFGQKSDENDRRRRIALIGLRGAGKSTVGK